jgi:MFS family permease
LIGTQGEVRELTAKLETTLRHRASDALREPFRLFNRQQRAFKINLLRKAFENYLIYTTQQFQSIYVVSLGANAGQLGLANSVGGVVSSVVSSPAGWVANKRGTRGVFMYGTILMALSALIFALAGNWWFCIPAIILITCSYSGINSVICPMICGSCVKTQERATGMQICDSLSAIPRLAAPLVAAFLIMHFGGLSASGIRPIFYFQFIGLCLLVVFIWKIFREPIAPHGFTKDSHAFFSGVRDIFNQGKRLKTWIVFSCLSAFPYYANPIFWPLYARTVKGADEITIGYMSMLMSLVPLVLAIPFGRLADKIGRKWVLAANTVLFSFSALSFIYARNQSELLISALLQGSAMVIMVTRSTMNTERVPTIFLGTWLGVNNLFTGIVGLILAPALCGFIWEFIGPSYVYLFILLLMIISLPILATIPDARKGG